MANPQHTHGDVDHVRRANPLGAYVATAGAAILLLSVWLDWLTLGKGDSEKNPSSGYEADGVIPLLGYLGIGFALALLYATKRADRRQHRGLSLASFAVGLASLLWALSFLLDPISTTQYGQNVSTEIGPWIAILGSLLWTVGSFLLAKEPEGDREHDEHHVARTVGHVDTHRVQPEVHRTTEHDVHRTTGTTTQGTAGTHGTTGTTGTGSEGAHRP